MTKVTVNKSKVVDHIVHHKVGNMYFERTTQEIYILCSGTKNETSMISLEDGWRWGESAVVKDEANITQEEFDIITEQMNDPDDFVLLNSVDITVV